MTSQLTISIVVPCYNSLSTLPQCVESVLSGLGEGDELIVVDDGSTDGTSSHFNTYSDSRLRFVRCDNNIGRGPARNRGAELARGDLLLFVDADVVLCPGTVDRVRALAASGASAFFGSYDDAPAQTTLTSQFRNLLHHHTHHHSGERASHFWTGLGAIRKEVFETVGGFDESRWARNMEDVELGHRLTLAGHVIHVRPEIQATHLKMYTPWSMFRSDLLDRAIPWTELLIVDRRVDGFVLSQPQRWSAIFVVVSAMSLLTAWLSPWLFASFGLGLVGFAVSNLHIWRFLHRKRGLMFTLRCVPLLYLHVATSVLGLVLGLLGALWTRFTSFS